jgi:GTP-binding protein EngB required for normal cell division
MTVTPPGPGAPPRSGGIQPITQAVQALANQAVALAGRRGRPDLVAAIRAEAERFRASGATVVLAGETNSGKSSLLNALVGYPDLSPVDVDVATGVHLVVRYSPTPTARVYLGEDPQGKPIEFADIAEWATVGGNPGNTRGVRAVEIGLDHPLLRRGLILIDTPGVGGLQATHTEITLAAMRRADALVLVTDASAELAEPQLAFLTTASERVDLVIVALTKTDAYRGWATVLERNRSIVAKRAAGLAELSIVPVSSHYHLRAGILAESGNEGAAGTIRGLGAIPRLQAEISARVIDRLELVRLRNLVRVCAMTIERLKLADLVQDTEADPELLEAMETERARMTALRHADAAWPRDLADGFQLLALSLNTELNRRVSELKRRYETTAAESPMPQLKNDLSRDLDLALRAMWTELAVAFADGVTNVLSTTADQLQLDRAGLPSAELDIPDRVLELPAMRGSAGFAGGQADLIGEIRTIAFGALPGAGIAGYAAQAMTGTLLGAALVPVGLAAGLILGVVAVAGSRRRRAELQDRQAAVTLVRDTLENVRTEVPPVLQRELTTVRSASERAIRAVLAARAEDLTAALKGRETLLREDAAARRVRHQQATQRLAELKPIEEDARRLATQLRRAAPGPPSGASASV